MSATSQPFTHAEREQQLLAPYAMFSRDTRGRRYPELSHPYRGPFQRDRDRILHSAAYRRLSGKMQVFTGDRGDYHRTRLTHTQEVASIARTMGRALRLNEDLIEALALFHDIGHPPYGHAGEDTLRDCLRDEGGFSHNRFALTLAEELEGRYAGFPGLNLSIEVLQGQTTRAQKADPLPRLLEVQIVELADSMAYDAHDTDDAVKLGLVTLEELREVSLIAELLEEVEPACEQLPPAYLRKALVHALIDRQVSDLLQRCLELLDDHQFESAEQASRSGVRLGPSEALAAQKIQLERFLYQRVYRHPELIVVRGQAQDRLAFLFDWFKARPEALPDHVQQRIERIGLPRAVGDYLAAMTDRFCDQLYESYC